eukprot:g18581.t1
MPQTDREDRTFDEEVAGAIKADVRMFSGCRDAQTSADVHDVAKFGVPDAAGGAGGACTNALLVNVKDHKPDSWMSLLKGMRATLKAKNFKQIPQLATSKRLDIRSPFSLAGGGQGNHRALLIGINYVGNGTAELKGCHNDVEQMRDYIAEHGYPAAGPNLKIVADDEKHEAPTKANILASIKWLVQGAKPGDSLFMHYSGHGGTVRDSVTNGDEADKRDETMVPADFVLSGQIRDDEILAELVLPLPEGVVLSVVMDCCHSGSILDLPYAFDANDSSLKLVDSGGSGVLCKKSSFDIAKMHKAQGKDFYLGSPAATAATTAPTHLSANGSAPTTTQYRASITGAQDQATSAEHEVPGSQAPQNRSSPQEGPKFQLSIENQVLKCMETGGYVAPDPVAFKGFASCEGDMEEDGKDDCDLSIFVITPDSVDEDSGSRRAAGISMLWVDSESSTGYSTKHITDGEARFAGKRAVYIEANKGGEKEAFLVAVFAPEEFSPATKKSGDAAPSSTTFSVWVCDQLAHARGQAANWTACGSFIGTKVKKVSATTSPSGERLVIVEAWDGNDEPRVFYGTSLGNEDLTMSTFPKPRAMADSNQQVSSVQASTLEEDGVVFAIAMSLPAPNTGGGKVEGDDDVGKLTLYAQSLNDPGYFGGSIEIPGDTRCFATAPAEGLKTDVYVAGLKKLTWYDNKPWIDVTQEGGGGGEATGIELNEIDFTSPAKEMRTVLDKQYLRHVFILLESGKLLYTSQAPDEGNKFDEPVDILPSVEAFSCHVDSIGNVHVNNISKDGKLMHHMMDQGTGMWMKKEVMVPGGAAREHIISVVDLKVTAAKQKSGGKKENIRDMTQATPPPPMSISCASGAMVRINGKGHLMYKDKSVQATPNMNGTVRIGQFVDSFSVPRVTVKMEGLDRPLEILCGKILHKKLDKMDASALKAAKVRDPMGNESGSLITDPDDLNNAEGFIDSVHQLVQGFETLAPTDFAKKDDVNGAFRLSGKALAAENQFVAFADESTAHEVEETHGDAPSAGSSAARSLLNRSSGCTCAEPVSDGVEEEKSTKTDAPGAPKMSAPSRRRPMVVRRFTRRRCPTPGPFGTGHLVVARERCLVECRGMGNFAKKARENADEAIFQVKKQAAMRLRVKAGNAERAQKRAIIYSREAVKWAAEAKLAMDAVHWTQAAVEAAQVAATSAEKEAVLRDVEGDTGIEPVGIMHNDALKAFETASQAMQAAAVAQEEAEEAKARRDEMDDAPVDADAEAYASDEYSSRFLGGVGNALKKAANATKREAEKAAKAAAREAKKAKDLAEKEAAKAAKAAAAAARKAEEEAKAAKRTAERLAQEAKHKADAAARAAKREAEKAAKAAADVAREAEKAAEHAASELEDQAKKAAAAAKREADKAAKLAEKTANDVKDGIVDTANDAKDGIVDAANDAKDGIVDAANDVKDGIVDAVDKAGELAGKIKDEVEDKVDDIADVVEDAKMKIVEVVEEVVEEVWEHTPDGLKLVARKVVKVVKKAVDFAVKIGNAVYHFVETTYEKLVMGLDWLWTKIKTSINAALDFLADFFGIAEILKTAEMMQASVVTGLDVVLATIPTEKDVRGFFNELRLTLEQATGLDLDAQEISDEGDDASDREVDPTENYLMHHAASGTFNDSAVEGSGGSEDGASGVTKSGDEDDGFVAKITAAFVTVRETGSVTALLSVLADGVLDMLEGAAVAAMGGLADAGKSFRDWIEGGGVVYIPVISEMYKLATGGKLKLGKAVFFMCSIHFTYACKGIFGKWPSELISHEILSGNKDRALAHARRTGKGFSSRGTPTSLPRGASDGDEGTPDRDDQRNVWGVLSMSSVIFSGLSLVLEGTKSIADAPTKQLSSAPTAILKSMALFAKACSILLSMSATMAVHDYEDGEEGLDKYPTLKKTLNYGVVVAMVMLETVSLPPVRGKAISVISRPGLSSHGQLGNLDYIMLVAKVATFGWGLTTIITANGDRRTVFAGVQMIAKTIAGVYILQVNQQVGLTLVEPASVASAIATAYAIGVGTAVGLGTVSVIWQWKSEDLPSSSFVELLPII